MAQGARKAHIVGLARAAGRVGVADLAGRFGVTAQTIRRDLAELVREGQLDRVHGGAVVPPGAASAGRAGAAAAIAAACAARIPENSSLLLDAGPAAEAVAEALTGHRGLTVVTTSLRVAETLAGTPGCRVVVTGGVLRAEDGGLVGDLAVQAVEAFKVERAVIGTAALDLDGDLMAHDLQDVRGSRAILRSARRTFLVADPAALEAAAPVRAASLRELDAVFAARLPAALRHRCRDWQTEVHETDPEAQGPGGDGGALPRR